jgi:hypothetical protein
MRTVSWDYDKNRVEMIDQRLLPANFEVVSFDDYRDVGTGDHRDVCAWRAGHRRRRGLWHGPRRPAEQCG